MTAGYVLGILIKCCVLKISFRNSQMLGAESFQNVISTTNLIPIDKKGVPFTWLNKRVDEDFSDRKLHNFWWWGLVQGFWALDLRLYDVLPNLYQWQSRFNFLYQKRPETGWFSFSIFSYFVQMFFLVLLLEGVRRSFVLVSNLPEVLQLSFTFSLLMTLPVSSKLLLTPCLFLRIPFNGFVIFWAWSLISKNLSFFSTQIVLWMLKILGLWCGE